ncbi:MAG: hypothetical protein ACYS0D_10370 [Planctomycetota bacterium]|jgi:hypothetical protein
MTKPLDDLFEKKAIGPVAAAALGAGATAGATGKGGIGSGVLGALAGPTVGGMVGQQLGKAVSPTGPESLKEETVGELFDPEHEAELTKIKTQAMMSDFMSNDPVISTYDPDEVTDAYNQVVQMAPRSAQQPAVMRGLLRKMLQQQDAMEPFEAEQVVKIEKTMKDLAEPAQRLMTPEAPPGG